MLGFLERLGSKPREVARPASVIPEGLGGDERVTAMANPAQILDIFMGLQQRGAPVQLQAPDSEWLCQGRINRLEAGRRELLFLAPPQSAVTITAGQMVNCIFEHAGREVLATLCWLGHLALGADDGHVLRLPDWLLLIEPRTAPRWPVHPEHPSWQPLLNFLGCRHGQAVRDIAEGGIGLLLSNAQADMAQACQFFVLAELLEPGKSFDGPRLQVCHRHPVDSQHGWVGCEFVGLNGEQERQLRKILLLAQVQSRRVAG